jgi:hypothetical protein
VHQGRRRAVFVGDTAQAPPPTSPAPVVITFGYDKVGAQRRPQEGSGQGQVG